MKINGTDILTVANPTTNYLPKFTTPGFPFLMGDSQIYDDGTSVGIGTNSPNQKLHVKGNMRFGQEDGSPEVIYTSGGQLAKYDPITSVFSFGSNTINVDSPSGYVGIGTTAPSTALEVDGVITATGGDSTEWNAKQNPITLTTTGSSGPATLIGDTLNIPEYSGGGGSSFYSYKLTAPVSLTGTLTETQMLRVEIPPNTFSADDVLNIPNLWYNKIGTAGNSLFRLKLSTSPTMPGGSTDQIFSVVNGATNIWVKYYRNFSISGGNIYGINSSTSSDILTTTTALLTKAFDPTVTNYLYISISLGNVADTVYLRGFNMNNI